MESQDSEDGRGFWFKTEDDRPEVKRLLENLKRCLPELEEMFEEYCGHWEYEDPVYRFYHQSYKVYRIQNLTLGIVEKLAGILPESPLNEWFLEIVREGTGREFTNEDNECWLEVTRPMLEAFFHARFFLEMAVRYGRELESPPLPLPTGWAALLYLYNLR